MTLSYDAFTGAFLNKISEFKFLELEDNNRTEIIDGFRKRATSAFKKNCRVDLFTTGDDVLREYCVDVSEEDADEVDGDDEVEEIIERSKGGRSSETSTQRRGRHELKS